MRGPNYTTVCSGFFNQNSIMLRYFLILILAFVTSSTSLCGQLESPFDCIKNHLENLQTDNYNAQLSALSFYGNDSLKNVDYAIMLKQVLDGKGLYVYLEDISKNVHYYDTINNSPNYILFPNELPQVYVKKIEGQWYYPPTIFDSIEEYHLETYPWGLHLLMKNLPKSSHSKILGAPIWQIAGSIVLAVIFLILFFSIRFVAQRLLKLLSSKSIHFFNSNLAIFHRVSTLLSLVISLNIAKIFLPGLQLGPKMSWVLLSISQVLSAFIVLLLIFKLIDLFYQYFVRLTQTTSNKMDEQLLPVLKRSIQIILLAFWFIYVLTLFNIDVTALLAGISIGGVAIALAAQDTIKNLFGSITIFMDKPFQIGDWIRFGEVEGTVEEVGFRSTRVRSFENSLMSVPNARLLDTSVNNYGLRQFRRFKTTLQITYNTPPEVIDQFVKNLRQIALIHPSIVKEHTQIYFNQMSSSSLDILFYTFFDVADWEAELKAKQEILLAIMRLAERMGIQFAYPSMSVYTTASKNNPVGPFQEKDFFDQYKQSLKESYHQT